MHLERCQWNHENYIQKTRIRPWNSYKFIFRTFSFVGYFSFCDFECLHLVSSHNSFISLFFSCRAFNKQQFFSCSLSLQKYIYIYFPRLFSASSLSEACWFFFFFLLLNLLSFKNGLCRILQNKRIREKSHHIPSPTSRKNVCVISSLNALYQAAFTTPGDVGVNNSWLVCGWSGEHRYVFIALHCKLKGITLDVGCKTEISAWVPILAVELRQGLNRHEVQALCSFLY